MPDTQVFPLAQELLACLTEALGTNPNPPANYCLRSGDTVIPDFNQYTDQCCEGLAYVRIARIFPSVAEFPVEEATWTPCHPLAYGVELEMGVWRCEPSVPNPAVDVPSCEQWTNATQTQMNDWDAMTRAACCFKDSPLLMPGDPVFEGIWAPLNSGGGCTGGAMPLLVGILACKC